MSLTGTAARALARVTGAIYLVTTLAGVFAEIAVRGSIVVGDDAAATARNIHAHEFLFRSGVVADIIATGAYVVVTVLLYELLKPVNRRLSLVAAAFSLIGCAVGAVTVLAQIAPLAILNGATYLMTLSQTQLESLALLSLKIHTQAYNVALTFFGVYCIMLGVLIFRSTYIPRAIAALIALAGASLLINSLALFLSPALYKAIPDAIGLLDLVGEAALTLWLLVAGVNVAAWDACTGGPSTSSG